MSWCDNPSLEGVASTIGWSLICSFDREVESVQNLGTGSSLTMSEKMKAAALSAATKGLSRVQAERAAANATRNVNAYGQKEEGPSRWQEKKEAKTQMYLKSTEKQATLNEKRCQKCRKSGHWTYECQKQALPENPKLDIRLLMSQDLNDVDMKKEEKAERGSKKEKNSKRKNKKRKHRSRSSSESSESESDHEDGGSRRKKKKKRSRRSNRGR